MADPLRGGRAIRAADSIQGPVYGVLAGIIGVAVARAAKPAMVIFDFLLNIVGVLDFPEFKEDMTPTCRCRLAGVVHQGNCCVPSGQLRSSSSRVTASPATKPQKGALIPAT